MTDLFNKTARIAAIALLAAAPVAAYATQSGSPQQSVEADPDEYVEPDTAAMDDPASSMENTPLPAGSDYGDAEVVDDVDGSMEDSATSDS